RPLPSSAVFVASTNPTTAVGIADSALVTAAQFAARKMTKPRRVSGCSRSPKPEALERHLITMQMELVSLNLKTETDAFSRDSSDTRSKSQLQSIQAIRVRRAL
ncbi:unnamed protein product, partial [Tilletia caries]